MKKKIIKIATILFLFLICSVFIDYALVENQIRPYCSIPIAHFKDGGTKVYVGFFHYVIAWNKLAILQIEDKEITGINSGFEFYISFSNHKLFPLHNLKPNVELRFKADS